MTDKIEIPTNEQVDDAIKTFVSNVVRTNAYLKIAISEIKGLDELSTVPTHCVFELLEDVQKCLLSGLNEDVVNGAADELVNSKSMEPLRGLNNAN